MLQQTVMALSSRLAVLSAECSTLATERDAAIAQRDAAIQENDKLLVILSQYKRTIFGPRSETLDSGQQSLFTIAAQAASAAGNDDAPGAKLPDRSEARGKQPARRNRGRLPEHLPRIDVVIDVETDICPCCGERLHRIGETVKEAFDVVPMQYRVKRIMRPRYGCRGCRQGVLQAAAPAQAVEGGMVTEALLAHIAVMKYGYQLPLYRQEQMFAAQGIALDRQTLASWMGRVAWWLRPLHALLRDTVISFPRLFADETPLPVLDPGRGRTRICQFWAIATDDRPWGGPAPPAVVYVFAEDRKAIRAKQLFGDYRGILQVDGYAAYKGLIKNGGHLVQLAFCFAHARRKFWDVHVATTSPIAAEALQRIAMFYAVEDRIRGLPAAQRAAVRQTDTRPLIEDFKPWLEARLLEVSKKSGLGKAIRYTLNHWEGLTRFIDDGRIEIDNNTVERTIKPIGLGKKNHLFAGSEGGAETWAILASLINSAKLQDIDPRYYLTDVLERIVSGRTKINQLHTLLPWTWKAERDALETKLAA
ncbi:transposase [Bradyrhizobium elkanii]|nr:IS66 family transposase [Bradyrhizobium elkanii]MCW2130719.1 transposase [Bradyrhizobium elkanii]MCW2175875.1 transposase [Bradyrhizobium elkanii]